MARITWDEVGKHLFETGVSNCVLYPRDNRGSYSKGVAWNGVISIEESPSGAEASPKYADNIKYLNLIGTEEFSAKIEAYTYPDEFAVIDGSASLVKGVSIGQQARGVFGLAYKTLIGNDVDGSEHGYKLHIIYGATASPASKSYSTMNDNPDALTFSWDMKTTPVNVEGFKPTASLVIDSTMIEAEKLKKIEDALYGTESAEAKLLLPDEIKALVTNG